MRPENRHELEAMGGIALLIFVILALVSWSLYEHGYLGIAVAVVGGVALSAGLLRASLGSVARRDRINQRTYQQEEERQEWLRWEQEIPPEYKKPPIHSESQERREDEEPPGASLEPGAIVRRLDEMSGGEFERLLAYYFRHQGYVVDTTPASSDRGADLIITVDERRICVRLKRQDEPVGNGAIREVLGGRAFYGAYEAWLIVSGTFANGIRYDAKVAGVRLVDGDELAKWLEKLPNFLEDEPR